MPKSDLAACPVLIAGFGDDLDVLIKSRQKTHEAFDGMIGNCYRNSNLTLSIATMVYVAIMFRLLDREFCRLSAEIPLCQPLEYAPYATKAQSSRKVIFCRRLPLSG
jgi:hypothetical protein